MHITPEQIRAARALLRIEQADLAQRANVSVITIRRIEGADGRTQVAPVTIDGVRHALEQAGAEFIPHGVRRNHPSAPEAAAMFEDLRAISLRSAARLADHPTLTDDDLYDEDGQPG